MAYQGSQMNQSTIGIRSTKRLGAKLIFPAGITVLVLIGIVPISTNLNAAPAPLRMAQIPATATVIYVSATGSDTPGAGQTEATAYKTITYALKQAQSGAVIQLAPGNYTAQSGEVFPLEIKSQIILRGTPADQGKNTVITGGGIYISPTFARQNITIQAESNSIITGITITNPNTRGTAVWIESANPAIAANTFTKSNREGIFITGTAAPRIENNVFIKNEGNGISIVRSAQGEIRENSFQDTGFGIAVGGNSSPVIAENQFTQNKDGIIVSDSARPVIRDNAIKDNKEYGILATSNAQPDLGTDESTGNNIIRNNGRNDVRNATSNTIVAIGNDIDIKKISGKVDFVAAQIAFQDIKGYWAEPYIKALAAKKIIAGFPDGSFKPNQPVTRAEFAAIISKAFAPTVVRPPLDFTDVDRKFWAYEPIKSAYRGSFMTGYPGGTFQPNQQIPRVQVLVSLANGLGLPAGNSNALSVYTDAAQIPSYAAAPVAAATSQQLVVNYPTINQLSPNQPATRAQVAAFVYQALVNSGKVKAIPSPYVVKLPS